MLILYDVDVLFLSDYMIGVLVIFIVMFFRNCKIGWLFVIFGFLIGFLRIWVGYYYLVDVLGSFVVFIIIGFLFFRFLDLFCLFVDLIVRIYEVIINKLMKK